MRKPAMLAALSLLLLALAACGAAEPAQTTDAAADTGTPEPMSWEGPGECYKAEPIETPEGAWPGCTQEYDGEICSLISTENGTLRVMRGSRSLLEPEGSRGYFMRCDENGCWLVTGGLEGVALRLYDFEGKKLLERALDEAPRSMLLAGGRAWLDFGDRIVVYGPDGSKEEIGPEGEYLGIVADRKGGVQLIRQEGEKLRITPIEGGEGFLTENGVLGCGAGSAFLYLAAADGHPAEIMDMSFAIQALSAEYLAKHRGGLKAEPVKVPKEIDSAVARRKLTSLGVAIDGMTEVQKEYMGV